MTLCWTVVIALTMFCLTHMCTNALHVHMYAIVLNQPRYIKRSTVMMSACEPTYVSNIEATGAA